MSAGRKLRALAVVGARPNFVRIAPLMGALRASDCPAPVEVRMVHTGEHDDDAPSRLFFDQLQIPRPDLNLEVGSGPQGRQTGEILLRLEPAVADWRPDVLLVAGDVNSTLAGALVAAKLCIPVAHVEGGLRSHDRSMPEEINRLLTDALSEFLFVSESAGVANLLREGIAEERIHLVGSVMIDSLRQFLPLARASSALGDFDLLDTAGGSLPAAATSQNTHVKPFALLSLHRPSNVDDPERLGSLLETAAEIGRYVPVIFLAHSRTKSHLERFGLVRLLGNESHKLDCGLRLAPPLGYLEFLHLLSEARMVLTDSSGIQEETTVLGVPCLTLLENTERPITVEQGTNMLVGADPARILAAACAILAGRARPVRVPELWDGNAATRICSILLERLPRMLGREAALSRAKVI